jgi:MFS family permease
MAIMSIGYPVGGTVGGFAAAMLLHHFDWPAVFFLGASLTALMMVPAYLWMVETPAFLIGRSPRDALARLNAYLASCGQPVLEALPASPAPGRRATYRQIFARDRRSDTIRMTAINLLFIVTVYYMLSWMPQLVAQQGYSASFATLVSTTACFSGAIVCVVLGLIGARLPLRWVAAGTMLGLAAGSVLFAAAGATPTTLLVLGALVGGFLYSGILALYSSVVATFDPEVRTTGVGFVMGVGRAAGAIAPTLAGLLFSRGFGRVEVTATLAAGALLAALLILAAPNRYAA